MFGIVIVYFNNNILWIIVDIFVWLLDWILVELCMIICVIGKLLIKLESIFFIFCVFSFWLVGVICLWGFSLFVVFR